MPTLREETKRLTALPASCFAPQTAITVAGAILLGSAAPTNGAAVAVLQQCIAGTASTKKYLGSVRGLLALIKSSLYDASGFLKKHLSPESSAARLASPFFLTLATT
jgi:hypothetical protein